MKIFKCSQAKRKTIDEHGTISLFFDDFIDGTEAVVKIPIADLLAHCAQACAIVSKNEKLPDDLIQQIQRGIEFAEDTGESEKSAEE